MDPLEPVRASVKLPVEEDDVELNVSDDVAGVLGEGVMGLVTVTVTPLGAEFCQE